MPAANALAMMRSLDELEGVMQKAVRGVEGAAAKAQAEVYEALREAIQRFEISDGRLVRGQAMAARLAKLESEIARVVGSSAYGKPIREYLGTFTTIEARSVAMQRTFNDVEVETAKLSPARKFVHERAKYFLEGAGLSDAYIQPAKYLLMQQVTTGMSIADALKMLERWDAGELTDGKQTAGRQTPNLQRYATQLARDTMYQYNGTVQDIIRTEYGLDAFIFTGDVIADTRPLCRHLVRLDRPITWDELPALLTRYPQGVIRGTTAENFAVYRGGYNCRHVVLAVRGEKADKVKGQPAPSPAPEAAAATGSTLTPPLQKKVEKIREANAAVLKELEEKGIVFDDHLVAGWNRNITITHNSGGSAYTPDTRTLNIHNGPRTENQFYKEKITLHEGGHAYHLNEGIITFDAVSSDFRKFYNDAKAIIAGKEQEIHQALSDELDRQTTAVKGPADHDALRTAAEKISILSDTLGSLTKGAYGRGHSFAYYNSPLNFAEMEVFAHSMEIAKLDVTYGSLTPELEKLVEHMKTYGSKVFE